MTTSDLPFPPPNLPTLLAYETLYSWCSQVHIWNGNASVITTSNQLYGKPYAAQLHDFPSHLENLRKRTLYLLPEAASLALNHTLLGFYLPFHEIDEANSLLDTVIQESLPQLKYKLGLVASRLGGDHPLKFCHQCVDMDLELHGRPAWHTQHQQPSSFICIKHGEPLHAIKLSATPVHLREFVLPATSKFPSESLSIEDTGHGQDRQIKLAQFGTEAHRQTPGAFNPKSLAWTYQHRLRDMGLLTSRGSIKIKDCCQLVSEYYRGFEQLPGFQILSSLTNSSNGFVGSITRKQPKKSHPFKHLLLMTCLFDSWNEFKEIHHLMSQNPPEWLDPPAPRSKQKDARKDELLELLHQQDVSIRAAAKKIGIDITTATQWAKQSGKTYTSRAKILNENKLEQIRNLLAQGKAKNEVAELGGVSLVTVNRILAADFDLKMRWENAQRDIKRKRYRKAFMATVDKHPGVPVKLLRHIPGNGYQWLYRHDRKWLSEHLPALW